MFSLPKKNHICGQIYLDILIAVAILTILTHALFSLVISTYELVSFTRARITARHLAQDKIEFIHNLPYDNVGTIGGIPTGLLPQSETVSRNGLTYTIKTDIVYIDDAFDQTTPQDTLPTDYKRIRVDVSWGELAASRTNPVTLITDIAPKGTEKVAGGGTLSILVFDANGQPVPQADVQIVASTTNPPVNLNLKTGDNGRIILPGAPVCNSCYQITATKTGFSTDRTYSTSEIANPAKPYLTILQGQLSEISFSIDKLSTVAFFSVQDEQNNFAPFANQTFILQGEKILGTDVADEPILKFDKTFTTDGFGQVIITDVEWDNYRIFTPEGSLVDICVTNPLLPLKILPGQTANATFALTSHSENNLLAIFKDISQNPLASVSASLFDDLGFQATESSGIASKPNFGQTFFKNLNSQIYHLEATASGFVNYSGSVNVSGQTKEEIIMNIQ